MTTPEPSDLLIDNHFAMMNSVGQAVLVETMREAAFYVTHSNQSTTNSRSWRIRISEARSCYIFVQGTGLGVLLHRFGLDYDPDKLQNTFNYCVRKS